MFNFPRIEKPLQAQPTDKNHRRDSSIRGKIVDVIRWPLFIRWAIF
jgi:hypothetical protein